MNTFSTIYIVRHGETEWNKLKKIQGHTDIPLNSIGKAQARELQKKLKDVHFDHVFSSDLLRARQTAEIITLERKIVIQTTKVLRERCFGKLEGKSWVNASEKLHKLFGKLANLTDEERVTHDLIGAENDTEVIARFIPFIRELAVCYPGKTILVACHGGLIRLFLQHTGFIPKRIDPDFDSQKTQKWISIKNTAYVKVESDGTDFLIKETFGIE